MTVNLATSCINLTFRFCFSRFAQAPWARRGFAGYSTQNAATTPSIEVTDATSRTRNIGIIAHIDAGKTTTTERMLYYAGHTRRIGNVDDGSTVTDFLPAERQRGITIQSAAITFHWPPVTKDPGHKPQDDDHLSNAYTINLIDTPGHADFTFEVLRSLRVLDGAVCILDGVAGVEAQTEKVWHQAQGYHMPKIIFVNKLDRDGAGFGRTVRDIASKLRVWPAVCQIPWYENGGEHFQGVFDVVGMRALKWPRGGDGKVIDEVDMTELARIDSHLAEEAKRARVALVEVLSEYDDSMVEKFIEYDENHLAIPGREIMASLRGCTLNKSPVVPVFAGASFRNIGVQPLLDAVTMLLPNPQEAPDPEFRSGELQGKLGELVAGKLKLPTPLGKSKRKTTKKGTSAIQSLEACALAFKVVKDPKRGVLVYVRVYQGTLNQHAVIFNTNLQMTEKVPRLLQMYGSDALEIPNLLAGQIGVITGLKHARTGDTLITCTGMDPKTSAVAPWKDLQLRPINVPPPVFFTGIEPISRSEEKNVEDALAILLREDPSLHLSRDEDTGQQLLSGMGELHLEIAKDRLLKDLKAKAETGVIEIGYRECISATSGPISVFQEKEIAGLDGKAGCVAQVMPSDIAADGNKVEQFDSTIEQDGNVINIVVKRSEESPKALVDKLLPAHLPPQSMFHALQTGALAALAQGPQHRYPLRGTEVTITIDPEEHIFGKNTLPAVLSSAARQAVKLALRVSAAKSKTALMEPMMHVKISLDHKTLGPVIHDISSRGSGQIISLDDVSEEAHDSTTDERSVVDLRKVYVPPDPYQSGTALDGNDLAASVSENRQRSITARVPLKEMVGYLKHLRSLTQGRGSFIMSVDCFEKMNPQREKILIKELGGFV